MDRTKSQGRSRITRAAMRDIAERAGVSIATVSRVLNGRPDVSAATRTSVLRLVREVGYVSNRVARASTQTTLIALSLPTLHADFVTGIVRGATDALYERDARFVICSIGQLPDPPLPLRERLLHGVTDGALLILPNDSNAELLALQQTGFPFVVIDPLVPVDDHIPVVSSANWAGAKMATEHLIGLGHTHIGIIIGPSGQCGSVDRLAGYQAALVAAGLPLVPALIQAADLTVEGGARAAKQLLERRHAPSAIFAINDLMAFGVLLAARDLRLKTPEDLSVIGFDDLTMASMVTPPLTTVQQPFQGLGRVGVDVLQRLLAGQSLPASRVELSTKLIIRESTASPPAPSFLTF